MDTEALTQFVTELLSLLGVSYESITVAKAHRTIVTITTKEETLLVGQGGETLRALTMVARRMVEAKYGEEAATFLLDVNGREEAKLDGMRQNALMLAQRARLFKHDVELPPMSPYERLVVHELFANDVEIKTESAGEGKFRHIVLKYVATRV